MRPWLAFLFFCLLGTACGHRRNVEVVQASMAGFDFENAEVSGELVRPSGSLVLSRNSGSGDSGYVGSGYGGGGYGTSGRGSGPTISLDVPDNLSETSELNARSIHYDGYTQLRVDDVDETADAISALAIELGGHVETLVQSSLVIRVPVNQFEAAFERIMAMGDVSHRTITATDVSESLTRVELRLETAIATRDRLMVLLSRAESELERIRLIREIQRLTDEIDQLTTRESTLRNLADLSRISVSLFSREALTRRNTGADIAEMAWIGRLSPFRNSVSSEGERLELVTPEEFVELDPRGHYRIESADGARLWTGTIENQLMGNTDFWIAALRTRLEGEFARMEHIVEGDFQLLRFVNLGGDPYTYVIGLRCRGNTVDLVEVYYPSATQEERYRTAIYNAISGGADS